MKKAYLLLTYFVAAIPLIVVAGNNDSALKTKATQWMSNTGGLRFLENKGQMMNIQRKAVNNVLFKAGAGGVDVYVTTDGLSYVFTKIDKHKKAGTSTMPTNFPRHHENDSASVQYCRADMELAGADIRKENIIKEGESEDRKDYYYGDICPDGILGVHSYGKITIKNIYPGIDWVLHTGKHGLKYDFVVHPGANPSLIRLKYKWTDKPELQDDGSLKINTPMGAIQEGTPVSYSADKEVQTTYSIADSEIYFNIGTYNSTQTLIIDPKLVWATYYPGDDIEEFGNIQDDGTHVWITGEEQSHYFPTVNPGGGAYFQVNNPSIESAFILKFNTAGVLEWATIYGGSMGEYGIGIYSDGTNVWMSGTTYSSNFPTLNPGGGAYYQGTLSAANNAYILKFSTAGIRKWATFYGGTGGETGGPICSDGTNVWLSGGASSTNLPLLNPGGGAYFEDTLKGTNIFIAKFNMAGVLKWATYYGGGKLDEAYSLNSDGTSVWLTGFTWSHNFPVYNPGGGAYFQANTGNNAFILKFDTAGVRKWAAFYGGSNWEIGSSIYSDRKNVWVTGLAYSTNIPLLNPGGGAYFQSTNAGGVSGFILKFNLAGVLKWATYYGGSGNKNLHTADGGNAVQSDGKYVWVTGEASSPDFPTYNPGCGFYQGNIGLSNAQDEYVLQFDTAGVRKWATYFGTDVENDGNGLACDGKNVFVAGDAGYAGYPLRNPGGGAYYFDTTIAQYQENLIIGRFTVASNGLTVNNSISICKGGATTITASGAISYKWSPPTGLSATNIPNPVASPTVTTTYTVTGVDTGKCGGTFIDSVTVTVDTFNLKNISITKDTSICSGSSITLSVGGGINYQWNTGNSTSSISITNDSISHTYTVSVSDGLCKVDTNVNIKVKPNPTGKISGNLFICMGNSTTLIASGGTSYQWSTGATTSAITISPSSNTNYSVTVTQNGCADTVSELVSINPPPGITACCDSTITTGQTIQLNSSGGGSYLWSPTTGLSCDSCPNPIATPSVTTRYYVIVTSDSGCTAKDSIIITIIPNKSDSTKSDSDIAAKPCGQVFVPNVFAPDENNYNNVLYVRGTCIATMDFKVFDRWGNKVFESQKLTYGWTGTYNGQPMNAATYVWYLKATLLDGTGLERKGNVTLVR